MKQCIGLFGGTFNPIHNCHISMAQSFIKELALDLLIIIPSGYSYHKINHHKIIADVHRYNMCKLAFEPYHNIKVSNIDMQRTGNTYTYDTVTNIRKIYPTDKLWWLLGSDAFLQLNNWYRYTELVSMISFAVALRNSDKANDIINKNNQLNPAATIKILNSPKCPISSTQIREGFQHKAIAPDWLPTQVKKYIEQNQLYTRER